MFLQFVTINTEVLLLGLSVAAELLVAYVIFYEMEVGRLDRFLADADSLIDGRNQILMAYCALPECTTPRNQMFKERLEALPPECELRKACDGHIRLLSRIGARRPTVRALRKTTLEWHAVVIMWAILGPYVEKKREESGPSYARSFLQYVYDSAKVMLRQERDDWLIRDPDRTRKSDVKVSRAELVQILKALKLSLKRK